MPAAKDSLVGLKSQKKESEAATALQKAGGNADWNPTSANLNSTLK
jgi:hypothetical protein